MALQMVSLLKYKSAHATPLLKILHSTNGDIQVLFDPWIIFSPPLGACSNVTLSLKPSLVALFRITILIPTCITYPSSLVYFYP